MKRLRSTIKHQLKLAWVVLTVISLFNLLLTIFVAARLTGFTPEKTVVLSKLLLLTISVFYGISFGSSLIRLKQSYLWRFLPDYRKTLVSSLVVLSLITGLFQSYWLVLMGKSWWFALLAPASVSILASQLLLARNLIMQITFVTSPLLIFQLDQFNIGDNFILLLTSGLAAIALYLFFISDRTNTRQSAPLFDLSITKAEISNSQIMARINRIFVQLLEPIAKFNKTGDLGVSLFHPSTRFGLPLIFTVIGFLFILSIDQEDKLPLALFIVFFTAGSLVNLFGDVGLLAKQIKSFSHVYASNGHMRLKRKILSAIDKQIMVYTVFLFGLFLFLSSVFKIAIPADVLLRLILTTALVTAALSPLMLIPNWYLVGLKIIGVWLIYIGALIVTIQWQLNHEFSDLFGLEAAMGIFALYLIRLLAGHLWMQRPIERFMRIYG